MIIPRSTLGGIRANDYGIVAVRRYEQPRRDRVLLSAMRSATRRTLHDNRRSRK